jgi:hypothetical protein
MSALPQKRTTFGTVASPLCARSRHRQAEVHSQPSTPVFGSKLNDATTGCMGDGIGTPDRIELVD